MALLCGTAVRGCALAPASRRLSCGGILPTRLHLTYQNPRRKRTNQPP